LINESKLALYLNYSNGKLFLFLSLKGQNMQHIVILLILLTLLVGVGTVIYTSQLRKTYSYSFLKSLLYYILLFNVMILVNLIYNYLVANIYDNKLLNFNMVLLTFFLLIVLIFEFGITYLLYRIISELWEKKTLKNVNRLFVFWGSLFTVAHIYSFVILFQERSEEVFYIIHEVWIFTMLVFIFSILLSPLLVKPLDTRTQKSPYTFIYIFLTGFTLYAFDQVDFYFLKLNNDLIAPLTLLSVNLCPIIWLRWSFVKHYPASVEILDTTLLKEKLELLAPEYDISNREQEIIEQICFGKSNKEIEEILFISFSTVKNHIYNIYKKLGVNSRTQLIRFIKENY